MMPGSDQTLILECWSDDLNPAQMASYEKAKSEQAAITEKLKELMKNQAGEELFIGEVFSAYQFQGKVQTIDDSFIVKIPTKYKTQSKHKNAAAAIAAAAANYDQSLSSRPQKRKAALAANIILDDDDDDLPLAKRIPRKDRDYNPSPTNTKMTKTPQITSPPLKDKKTKVTKSVVEKDKEKVVTPFRPSEISSIGGLTVGLNKDDANKSGTESKDAAKLQGKTFPSLVVIAKPFLKVKEQSGMERSALDSKVKVVLMLTPAKFTEWLIQQGLLKSEQKCAIHPNYELKLGVYSDGSKFPYSGGYVWISECCPTRFISVFHGSLFEGAPHPPSCILKLIYHWACQTNIQNVVQWVKVDNLYIKGVYTWLRAICTLALNKHLKLMGGHGKYVEVGVISLGTTAQDGQQRQVKVEVLGVLDHSEKAVRLRAIEPFTDGDRSYKKRFAKILEPLNDWVLKESIITIDLTVDKTTLNTMGFKNVLQVPANDTNAKHTNSTIMDYLRRIVPRMFQNTLSLLSRQMIQQFLDELVWREQFGSYPLQAFDNITAHLAEQTRIDAKDTLTQRLYQVATNPFKNWTSFELNKSSGILSTPSRDAARRAKKTGKDHTQETIMKSVKISTVTSSSSSKKEQQTSHKKSEIREKSVTSSPAFDKTIETKGLEEIYYGISPEDENQLYNIERNIDLTIDLECPHCSATYKTNSQLQTDILKHIDTESSREDYKHQCVFCLEKLPSERGLRRHESIMHPSLTKHSNSVSYHCLICQIRFNTVQLLCTHLQRIHVLLELPYICYACGYRSSSHHNIIVHFYKNHHNENMLQCPLCLAVFWIFSNKQVAKENIKEFYNHMHRHFEKSNNKKCNKCVLTFITKGELKYHALKDHHSFHGNSKVYKLTDSTANIPAPKHRAYTSKATPTYKTLTEYPSLILDITGGKLCLECDRDLDEGVHINGFYKCQKCEYKTCCLRAMLEHTSSPCQSTATNIESYALIPLDKEMHCVCGFSSSEGNSMARHLAVCDHKSAYPSVEAAQENTVKRNMLDMLGLVRREDEADGGGGGGSENDATKPLSPAVEADTSAVGNEVDGGDISMTELKEQEKEQEQGQEQEEEQEKEHEQQHQQQQQDEEVSSQIESGELPELLSQEQQEDGTVEGGGEEEVSQQQEMMDE